MKTKDGYNLFIYCYVEDNNGKEKIIPYPRTTILAPYTKASFMPDGDFLLENEIIITIDGGMIINIKNKEKKMKTHKEETNDMKKRVFSYLRTFAKNYLEKQLPGSIINEDDFILDVDDNDDMVEIRADVIDKNGDVNRYNEIFSYKHLKTEYLRSLLTNGLNQKINILK